MSGSSDSCCVSRHGLAGSKLFILFLLIVFWTSSISSPPLLAATTTLPHDAPISRPSKSADRAALPLAFEQNAGQTDPSVKFLAHAPAGVFYFTQSEVVLSLNRGKTGPLSATAYKPSPREVLSPPAVVRLQFEGAHSASIAAQQLLPGKVNYLLGSDPAGWHKGLPTYGQVTYSQLYPGIDLVYTGENGLLKGTYTVAPGTDPSTIQWRYSGASGLAIDSEGNLNIGLGPGPGTAPLVEQAPVAWQEIAGKRVPVAVRYALSPEGTVSFVPGAYSRAYPLVIDPVLVYSGYLGGTGDDFGMASDTGNSSTEFIAGYTQSVDFPVSSALQPLYGGGISDAFVTELNFDGTGVMFSTYLGGSGEDAAYNVHIGPSREIMIVGETRSTNFPTLNAYQATLAGGSDAFLTMLTPDGSAIAYSGYYGGSGDDVAYGIGDSDDTIGILVGKTSSTDLPLQIPVQAQYGGGTSDAFVVGLAVFQPLLDYASYVGGSGEDAAYNMEVAGDASNYVAGVTFSPDFPTRNPIQPQYGGNGDAFALLYPPFGQTLSWSTYLGGSGFDAGHSITGPGNAVIFIAGVTASTNFPLANPYQGQYGGGASDAFLAHIHSDGRSLDWSTYLGGSGADSGMDVAPNIASLAPSIVGWTDSTDFPLVNPLQDASGGGRDAFAVQFPFAGGGPNWSTYLGGSGDDMAMGTSVAWQLGRTYIAGYTHSTDFPVAGNSFQPQPGGGVDAIVAAIDDQSQPTTPTRTRTITPSPSSTPTTSGTATHTGTPTPTGTPQRTATATITQQAATHTPTAAPTNSATPTASPTACAVSFTDVHPTDYFYGAARYLACRGAISGYSDGTFRPYNNTTRGQLSKIVVLAEGWTLNTTGGPHFLDVQPDNPFYAYIETAYNQQVISGYADGTFRWGNNVTRAQLCKIVVLAEGWSIDTTGGPHFTDVPAGDAFYPYIETAYNRQVVSGYSDGTFLPGSYATRGQIVKIVYNAVTAP